MTLHNKEHRFIVTTAMLRALRLSVLTLLTTIAIGNQSAMAQLFYSGTEYGITGGGSQYFGDLNDKYGFKFIRPAAGAFLRFHLSPYISVRTSLTATQIGYEDKFNDNDFYRARNLSFKSNIVEASVQSEFNFTRFETGDPAHRFTPYLTGGVGVFYYNPVAEFEGKTYALRPLGTEGQNLGNHDERKYHSVAVCFPVGAGFKYWLKPGFNLGFEIADRLTLTDYLDDVSTSYVGADKFYNEPTQPNPAYYLQDRSTEVSGAALGRDGKQRGNSQTRDQYMYFVINLSFQLKVYRCPGYLKEGSLE
jgi:hypothetical protein